MILSYLPPTHDHSSRSDRFRLLGRELLPGGQHLSVGCGEGTTIVDHHIGMGDLIGLRGLSLDPALCFGLTHSTGPHEPFELLGGLACNHPDRITALWPAGLDQFDRIDHCHPRTGSASLFEPGLDRIVDGRVNDLFEPFEFGRVAKDDRSEGAPVDRPARFAEDRGAKSSDDRLVDRLARLLELVRDRIGIDDMRPKLAQLCHNGALATGDISG